MKGGIMDGEEFVVGTNSLMPPTSSASSVGGNNDRQEIDEKISLFPSSMREEWANGFTEGGEIYLCLLLSVDEIERLGQFERVIS